MTIKQLKIVTVFDPTDVDLYLPQPAGEEIIISTVKQRTGGCETPANGDGCGPLRKSIDEVPVP